MSQNYAAKVLSYVLDTVPFFYSTTAVSKITGTEISDQYCSERSSSSEWAFDLI